MSACHCGAVAFGDFDRCADHVPRMALICEVLRLRWKLNRVERAEPTRCENNNPPSGRRMETTILERM
jgi:hypothetical protein